MLGRGLQSLIPNDDDKNKDDFKLQEQSPSEKPDLLETRDEEKMLPPSVLEKEDLIEPPPPAAVSQARKFSSPKSSDAVFWIEVEKIKPNPHQPRRHFDEDAIKELASSIREIGILQPLVVTKIENESEFGTNVEYQLIAGERRLMAAKKAGLERVPAIIRRIVHAREKLELAIIENLQREDLNPIEEARAYSKLQDEFGMTQREIGTRIGKSREVVSNTMRLLNLPSMIQDAIAVNKINPSQARVLLSIEDLKEQQKMFDDLLSGTVTLKQLKTRLSHRKMNPLATKDPELMSVEEKLTEVLGTPVKVERIGKFPDGGGKIIISYYSTEELDGLLKKFDASV